MEHSLIIIIIIIAIIFIAIVIVVTMIHLQHNRAETYRCLKKARQPSGNTPLPEESATPERKHTAEPSALNMYSTDPGIDQ